ncbi:MAG: hypothetical protein Q7S05_00585 [bacterium]|nr:hypothetical protein [bacterium]
MTDFILKILGFSKETPEKKDDFSHFFLEAKSGEKAKVIRRVLKEATAEQETLLKKYHEMETV